MPFDDFNSLIGALGYDKSSLYREDEGEGLVAPTDQHWIRSARNAGAKGTYFFKTSPKRFAVRPAVHVADATTVAEARGIHRRIWNQGVNPFLIIVMPGQVRVLTGFAFDPDNQDVGAVTQELPTSQGLALVIEALSAFTADAIDRGEIWQRHAGSLSANQRVDTTLLSNLRRLSLVLQTDYSLSRETSHALIGKFVYLSYLRARDIVSDKWLTDEAAVEPGSVFKTDVFTANLALENFRKLARAVETRFNGKLFPIAWGSSHAPRADAVRRVAQVFAGEEVEGQMHLSFRAYDFASIPVEFLSSIYEQFLHAEGLDTTNTDDETEVTVQTEASDPEKRGAHYTPEPLADYLVSEIHSVKTIQLGMKVLDPCCGSGVFLVVVFRRLVELECKRQGTISLNASELRTLLENSIYAVERNPTACQIAGFSLILAMLSYVEPPELHQRKSFKFPTLIGKNLFPEDFFNEGGKFWKNIVSSEGKNIKFNCVIGNPPWVESASDSYAARHFRTWYNKHKAEYALARDRTGEAFAWRVIDCLADRGAVGLILHAKTLTNDHLHGWRKNFFGGVHARRVTNFSNMKYVLFASARHPCFSLVYQSRRAGRPSSPIQHFGPFVANQCVTKAIAGKKRRAWSIGFSESEIKTIRTIDAESGDAGIWKMALWGNERDKQTIQRLCRVFSTTLGKLSQARRWTLALGLQLRPDKGSQSDPNEEVLDEKGRNVLEGLKVLNHLALIKTKGTLTVSTDLLEDNDYGCFVRKGRHAGLALTAKPRLFLWNGFAAYSAARFIIRHDKVCLTGGNAAQMKAIAAIWNSNFANYLLFFITNAAWGIGYSVIDKGDAENLPFPELTPEQEERLCAAWEEAAASEANGENFASIKLLLDRRVATIFKLPESVQLVVSEFFNIRFELNEGKNPLHLRAFPEKPEMLAYALRLRSELDAFLGGKAHHQIRVLYSSVGISVSVTLTQRGKIIAPEVSVAKGTSAVILAELLAAAETQFSQWVYVKRSVRIFDGDTNIDREKRSDRASLPCNDPHAKFW